MVIGVFTGRRGALARGLGNGLSVLILGLIISLFGGVSVASAQDAAFPVAVVDVQDILRSSAAAQQVQARIDDRRQAYQRQVTDEEQVLRQTEQDLQQQRAILASEAYQQRLREFRDRVAEVQRSVQQRRRALDQAFAASMNKVRDTLVEVIAELADENGVKVVLLKTQIVIAEKSLDISEEALRRLNERLPSVEVTLPPIE